MTKRQRIHPVEYVALSLLGALGIYAIFVAISLEQREKEKYPPRLELALPAEGGASASQR